jgi:hypothetical protein
MAMNLFSRLLQERCPVCDKVIDTVKSQNLHSIVIKECELHYRKEFHPALETYIETVIEQRR